MRAFAKLYSRLDSTTKTTEKVAALTDYFKEAGPDDAAWAIFLLIGRKMPQAVPTKRLRAWAGERAGLPEWLLGECHDAVGDLSETIALVLPPPERESDESLSTWMGRLQPLRASSEEKQREAVFDAWSRLDTRERFLFNKLISGAFRVGVAAQLVIRGLAEATGRDVATLSHRLMGDWAPTAAFARDLFAPETEGADPSRPYPFCLAHPLGDEGPAVALGDRSAWQVEWKWDGIRGQLIRRAGVTYLWTRGEELVTDRYPEIEAVAESLPDGVVLDGEILPWGVEEQRPLPFAALQRRIGRKNLTRKILNEVPVVFLAFDLLEREGCDVRGEPLRARREHLARIVTALERPDRIALSAVLDDQATWDDLAASRLQSRANAAEGFMLKRLDSTYRVGRARGDWWKWKVEPMTLDAVLTAAQRGSGKRASLYTDYTFSVWNDDGALVPIAKAYSGLTDAEIREVDAFVRRHMVESFGPVRTVRPELVFELAFEGIQRSPRHKSGIALRFPRILRQRTDKRPDEADTLVTIRTLLPDHP
jgi:DNA ligase-1